jgi:hypothetical protein
MFIQKKKKEKKSASNQSFENPSPQGPEGYAWSRFDSIGQPSFSLLIIEGCAVLSWSNPFIFAI